MMETKESLARSVLEKIKREGIKMRPRYYFVLRGILMAMSIAIVFLAGLYVSSFIFFIFKESDLGYLPHLGPQGLGIFLQYFPWLLLVIIIIFIVVLQILVKRYRFAYRQPLLYSALAIVALMIFLGIVIRQTSFHERIFREVDKGHFGLAKPFYKNFGPRPIDGIYPGTVLEITPTGFILETPNKTIIAVSTSTTTLFPNNEIIKVGDRIMIMGDFINDTLEAKGIKQRSSKDARQGFLPPPPPPAWLR